ncbi:MAG: hypothetical protein EHM61_13480 [Acidobacteria bacterium]|nr:MAG: hypothetical protein EHM61_13480 [Acidobacteriota bacterium]
MIGRRGSGRSHALGSAGFNVLFIQLSLFLSLVEARPPDEVLTGDLTILAIDQKDQSGRWTSRTLPLLVGAGGEVTTLKDPSNLLGRYPSGKSVRVTGIRTGQKLLATSVQPAGGNASANASALAVPPPSIRGQTTLVALLNYADNPVQPFTLADVRQKVMDGPDSANKFILESSLGGVWLESDFIDWHTLPGKQSDYFG